MRCVSQSDEALFDGLRESFLPIRCLPAYSFARFVHRQRFSIVAHHVRHLASHIHEGLASIPGGRSNSSGYGHFKLLHLTPVS
jgi:hypothetical protein